MKNDKPYGGADFRVKGNRLLWLKVAPPHTPFKAVSEWKDPMIPESMEPWMNNSSERLNRYTVRFFTGTFEHDLTKRFEQFGQNATWWVSPDWTVIYIATTWTDYKQDNGPDGYGVTYHKLWKSGDGGMTWRRLPWPQVNNISQLAFLDANRGYAIGWGPHIWRTADGGQHWNEIEVPVVAYRVDSNQTRAAQVKARSDAPIVKDARFAFTSSYLAPNGVLFFAFYSPEPHGRQKDLSLVYALRWEDPVDIYFRAQQPRGPEMAVPQATVVDMLWVPAGDKGIRSNALYLLTEQGVPHNYDIPHDSDRKRPAGIWRWTGSEPMHLKTFDDDIAPGALNLGRDNLLMIDASSSKNEHDIALISRDGGESWDKQDEGPGAAGGYFGNGGVTKWRYFGNSLHSREIR
ncbi:WD40/YVTN/BNR-like repeat-containing protein [Cupriavidus oxalaticus]|uniref:WD40/YVTN/BNR-like repeat-containing protein n=1 Tax=Cupriavidus oxalaticus TaxID=96344 RepID=UPI003F73E99D